MDALAQGWPLEMAGPGPGPGHQVPKRRQETKSYAFTWIARRAFGAQSSSLCALEVSRRERLSPNRGWPNG